MAGAAGLASWGCAGSVAKWEGGTPARSARRTLASESWGWLQAAALRTSYRPCQPGDPPGRAGVGRCRIGAALLTRCCCPHCWPPCRSCRERWLHDCRGGVERFWRWAGRTCLGLSTAGGCAEQLRLASICQSGSTLQKIPAAQHAATPRVPPVPPSGAAFDVLHLTLQQLLLILTAAALVEAAGWCAYAFLANRSERGDGLGSGYQPVQQKDTDEQEPH